MRCGARAGALALALACALALPSGVAAARLPAGFAGVVPQGPLSPGDFDRIGGLGLGLRLGVSWRAVEEEPGAYDFSALDAEVGAAADRGITVLPVVYGTPAWLRPDPFRPPLGRAGLAAWRGFLRELVRRYGRGGEFWQGRGRRVPLRRWQLWNEPNFPIFWRPGPSPAAYAKLLHAGAAAIRGVDPRAQIVAAGLAPIERQPPPWQFLRRLYRVPGFRADADLIALHPYSARFAVLAERVGRMRAVMAAAGDARKSLLITEIGAASSSSRPDVMDLGLLGQASYLEQSMLGLARFRRWRIGAVYWYAWQDKLGDDPTCQFCPYVGLLDADGAPKPAWWALRRLVVR